MDSKPKRKGRPLLVAAAGIAFVSYINCEPSPNVGNLRGPDPRPEPTEPDAASMDSAAPDAEAPTAVPAAATDAAMDGATSDAAPRDAAATRDAGPPRDASAQAAKDAGLIPPVGNLRAPPPPRPFPVGNLRAPAGNQ